MMLRKLVKSGLSSHVVALPKEFLEDNKLKTGDMVKIDRQGTNKILVSTINNENKKDEEGKIQSISTGKRDIKHIQSDIVSAYIQNCKEMIIKFSDSSYIQPIKQIVGNLVALEVVQEDNEKIVAKDFLDYKDKEVERTIKRMEYIVLSMLNDLKDIHKYKKLSDIIISRDQEVNKLNFLSMRVLYVAAKDPVIASQLNLDPTKILKLWNTSVNIEKIGDEAKRIGRVLMCGEFDKKHLHILEHLITLYKDTFTAIYKEDIKMIYKNLDTRDEIVKIIAPHSEIACTTQISGFMMQILSNLGDINRIYRYMNEGEDLNKLFDSQKK